MPEPLHRLLYVSRWLHDPCNPQQCAEVDDILAASRRNNPRFGVTGVLLFTRYGTFQVLEGPRDMVERLFERIQLDPRHDRLRVVAFEPIAARRFDGWAMAFIRDPNAVAATEATLYALSDDDRARLDADEMCCRVYESLVEDVVVDRALERDLDRSPARPAGGRDHLVGTV